MRRRDLLLTLPALAGIAGCSANAKRPADPSPSHAAAVERAIAYLMSKQASDGGWHSEVYGLLRSGQSLTPFVLLALLEAGVDPGAAAVARAIRFIDEHTDSGGCLGRADSSAVDYPNYATGLALRAVVTAKLPGWKPLAQRMTAYLRDQQFGEHLGWKPDDAAYGGWGIGGGRRTPPHSGHVDLCMTRHVLEGLAAAGLRPDDPAFARARVFVNRCQNFSPNAESRDGGFFFSTVVLDANKAGEQPGGGFVSYGTMTADGILALAAMGVSRNDARLTAARQWMEKHRRADGVPGFDGEPLQRWTHGLFYYYVGAVSDARAKLGRAPDNELSAEIARRQRQDGSWSNPENLVKEDDPLIATPFALRALAAHANPRLFCGLA